MLLRAVHTYPNMRPDEAPEFILCSECGKKMIKRDTGITLSMYPPIHSWYWWCGCGHEQPGGKWSEKSEEEILRERWEEVNKSDE